MAALKGAVSKNQNNKAQQLNTAKVAKDSAEVIQRNPQASGAAIVSFSKESEIAQQVSGQVKSDDNARAKKVARFKAIYEETGTIPFDTYAVAEKFAATMGDMLG